MKLQTSSKIRDILTEIPWIKHIRDFVMVPGFSRSVHFSLLSQSSEHNNVVAMSNK